MYEVVLPALGLDQLAASGPVATTVLNHVIFGVAVALGFVALRQRRATRPSRPRVRETAA